MSRRREEAGQPRRGLASAGSTGTVSLYSGETPVPRASASHSMMIPDEDVVRRRKIRFRAWHRGTREMDLIMGRFADSELARLDEAGLDSFEALMEQPDPDLYKWVSGEAPVPSDVDASFLARIREFHTATGALRG